MSYDVLINQYKKLDTRESEKMYFSEFMKINVRNMISFAGNMMNQFENTTGDFDAIYKDLYNRVVSSSTSENNSEIHAVLLDHHKADSIMRGCYEKTFGQTIKNTNSSLSLYDKHTNTGIHVVVPIFNELSFCPGLIRNNETLYEPMFCSTKPVCIISINIDDYSKTVKNEHYTGVLMSAELVVIHPGEYSELIHFARYAKCLPISLDMFPTYTKVVEKYPDSSKQEIFDKNIL